MLRTLALCLLLATPAIAHAQEKTYPNGRGGEIKLPMGDLSFADEVVSFTPGTSTTNGSSIAQKATGIADFKTGVDAGYVQLGCGGDLVVRFTDNALTDVPGNDLYVFETAPNVEQADVFISEDGAEWTKVGMIEGATTAIDIKDRATTRDTCSYVKVTDRKSSCTEKTPGADIDAIAAIGSAKRASFDSAVLFDTGKSVLKAGAADAL